MKFLTPAICVTLLSVSVSCSQAKKEKKERAQGGFNTTQVQSEASPEVLEARNKATPLTEGWPQSSVAAATEMIQKHGDPAEVTDKSLIWRNVAPFERIVVHKEVHSSNFPVLHQNAVDHVVSYRVPVDKVEDIRKFNGDLVIDGTRGELTASGESEAMNILTFNLANEVIKGQLSPEEARTQYGKDTLALMNGKRTARTQALSFGEQVNTSDKGKPMSDDLEWKDEKPSEQSIEAQEE